MEDDTTLRQELQDLNKNLKQFLDSGKAKKIKTPKKPSKSQVKRGYVYVYYINDNKEIEPMKVPVEEATTLIEKSPRLVSPEYMFSYKGAPAMILPSYSAEPIKNTWPTQKEVSERGLSSAGYRLLANRVELGQLKAKKKISGGMIFAIIIVVLIAGYFLLQGGI